MNMHHIPNCRYCEKPVVRPGDVVNCICLECIAWIEEKERYTRTKTKKKGTNGTWKTQVRKGKR